MNIFKGWENHTERIAANWKRLVKPSDTVILPGDFSWGLKLEETKKDFEFLENLPGKKILLKGNHDLWWSTSKKLREFLDDNKFNSIDFIFNNCAVCEGYAVAGTRGWFFDDKPDPKILQREAGRLELSLSAAEKRPSSPPARRTISSDAMRLTPLVASPCTGVNSKPSSRASAAHAR